MHYLLLGPMSVVRDDQLVGLGGLRQRGVLAALLLAGGRTIDTDALVDMVWGDTPPPKPIASLRAYIANLRRILSGDRLVTDHNGYRLNLGSDLVDIREFESLVCDGRRLLAAGDDVAAARVLECSLRLWRGTPLADFRDQAFVHHEVHRLQALRVDALEARFDAQLGMGRNWELIAPLESEVAAHPLREKLWAQLMLAMYRAGRRADALQAYRRAHALLDAELGVEPGAELQRIAAAIRDEATELHWRRTGSAVSSPSARPSHVAGRSREVLRVHSALRAAGRGGR
ncbi:AfsR/SARP family transcriptional regulator [Mycolicibacterium wolinskyi]|uniref:AfsR/SARP family transcriptional regulator n=1 Tax=Mycolicibacterium wolinskyi TaxID=59750 RepID=UPI00391780C3